MSGCEEEPAPPGAADVGAGGGGWLVELARVLLGVRLGVVEIVGVADTDEGDVELLAEDVSEDNGESCEVAARPEVVLPNPHPDIRSVEHTAKSMIGFRRTH